MENIIIRNASIDDAERLAEIYKYYVDHTAITFEYTAPEVEEFRDRMSRTMEKFPYLVIEKDGSVAGYAYAGSFVGREAYDWACEMTIYLDKDASGAGLGGRLYQALEERLRDMGYLNLYACIGVPEVDDEYLTHNSVEFHTHLGYKLAGTFKKCGYKFGRWYDMVWMEKIIGDHKDIQPEIDIARRWISDRS